MASQLQLPKSTVSRRIQTLETQLGQRLMTRTTRKLLLTEFGERMLEHARRLQDESQAAWDLAQNEQVLPRGVLRVSLPPDLAQLDLSSLLIQFAARFPDVRVELDLSARRVDIVAERIDLAVRIASQLPDDTMLVARKLCDMPVHLYASPAYIRQFGEPQKPEDLMSHACLRLISSAGESVAWRLQHESGKQQDKWEGLPRGPLSSNSPALQRQLAVNGMGVVALADALVAREVLEGRLMRVLPSWSLPTLAIWCVTLGRRLLPAKTKAFIEILQNAVMLP